MRASHRSQWETEAGMFASAPQLLSWADRYEKMKETYRKPVETFHASAPEKPMKNDRTLAEDQVRAHLRQREFNEENSINFAKYKRNVPESGVSKIKPKDMESVQMCMAGRCISMDQYLKGRN